MEKLNWPPGHLLAPIQILKVPPEINLSLETRKEGQSFGICCWYEGKYIGDSNSDHIKMTKFANVSSLIKNI